MNDQEISAIQEGVDKRVVDDEVPKLDTVHSPHEGIVIAWGIEDFASVVGLVEGESNDVCRVLAPLSVFSANPAVNDVSDQIKVLA
jgi:hypothetical protein